MGRNNFSGRYRLIPVLFGSLLIFAIICAVLILIWSLIVFLSKTPVGAGSAVPVVIWLAALAASTVLMTLFTRGGTVWPAVFLAVVSVIFSCFFATKGVVTFGGLLLKLLISLAIAVVAFIVTKLIARGRPAARTSSSRRSRPRRHKAKRGGRRQGTAAEEAYFEQEREEEIERQLAQIKEALYKESAAPTMISVDDDDFSGFKETRR